MSAVYYCLIDTPLGEMELGISENGICMFEFPVPERIRMHKKIIGSKYSVTETRPAEVISSLEKQLDDYFRGVQITFELPMDFIGTDFQKKVWDELMRIPYGKTISYDDLAKQLEMPSARRAVASANGKNRTAIIVPCHRVISKNGQLGGYSGEVWRKEILLEKENGQHRLQF